MPLLWLIAAAAGAFGAQAVLGPPPGSEALWRRGSIGGVQPHIGQLTIGEAEAFLQGGLVGLNRYQLRGGTPPISQALHEGRVVYDRRDPTEHFRSIREIWEAGDGISGPVGVGRGDCEDLAAALAAELCEAGIPAELVIRAVRPGLSHAVVRIIATGELLDPSRTGGMGWQAEHRARFGLADEGGNVSTRPPDRAALRRALASR